MILSGHQPTYLPGIILFNKIALSSKFMLVGHCQQSPKSWHNHNQIRSGRLTVPIQHNFGQSIDETKTMPGNWKRKHLKAIELCYGKRPYFKDYFDRITALLSIHWESLGAMNKAIIDEICRWLDIKTDIIDGAEFDIQGQKNDMLASMCHAIGANEYLSNEGARTYVDEPYLKLKGVTHHWQKFVHPIYDQGEREFITNLSIIDLLFNCGPASGEIVRGAGHVS